MALYDTIGVGYPTTRPLDKRLADFLFAHLALPAGAVVVDVGAGTGKYARHGVGLGYRLIAVEPSQTMIDQGGEIPGVRWIKACAEDVIPGLVAQGAMAVLTVHHWQDLERGVANIRGWLHGRSPFLLFTYDPLGFRRFWLTSYFAFLAEDERIFRPRSQMQALLGRHWQDVEVVPFPLPHDLRDQFLAAHWRHPEAYTRPEVLAGMSTFATQDPVLVQAGVARLRADLDSGKWLVEHGAILEGATYDAGYYLLRARDRA